MSDYGHPDAFDRMVWSAIADRIGHTPGPGCGPSGGGDWFDWMDVGGYLSERVYQLAGGCACGLWMEGAVAFHEFESMLRQRVNALAPP